MGLGTFSRSSKSVCCMIGVWGFALGYMQVHLVLLIFQMHCCHLQCDRLGEWRHVLQRLENMSLYIFVALWAGSVFNTYHDVRA